jgi:anti-anti-sigma factor
MPVTAPPCPKIRLRERGRVAVVILPGEIDLANAGEVLAALTAAVDTGAPRVIADMAGTRFCGTEGARALMRAAAAAEDCGAQLRVVGAGRMQRKVLEILGLEVLLAGTGP